MSANLETRINRPNQYKSAGERKIAEILIKYGIPFKYESPLLIRDDQSKSRLWYPDFYLPTFGIYVEYFGFNGVPNYDSLCKKKDLAYKNVGLDVVAIDVSVPSNQLGSYMLNHIYIVQKRRFDGIRSSIYGLRTGQKHKYR